MMGMVTDKDIWKVGLLSRIHFTWPIPSRIPSTIKWKCTDKKDLQNGMRWQKRTYSFWNEYNFDMKHHRPTAALRSSSMMNSHFARGELARSGPHQSPTSRRSCEWRGHESDINMAAFVLIILPPSVHPAPYSNIESDRSVWSSKNCKWIVIHKMKLLTSSSYNRNVFVSGWKAEASI